MVHLEGVYTDAKEVEPPDAQKTFGEPLTMTVYVDADHAEYNNETWMSHSTRGITIFANLAPALFDYQRDKQ